MKNYLPATAALLCALLLAAKVTLPPLTAARAQQQSLQQNILSLRQDAAQLPAERQRQRQLTGELNALKNSLPDNEDLPQILSTINEAAKRLSLTTGRVTRSARDSEIPGITAVDFELNISGSYARLQALVQTIARLPRAFTSKQILVSATNNPGIVTSTLKLTAYKRADQPIANSAVNLASAPEVSNPQRGQP